MKTDKLKVRGIAFKRYMEMDTISRHSIEIMLEGEIPHAGLSTKQIIKLLKKYY